MNAQPDGPSFGEMKPEDLDDGQSSEVPDYIAVADGQGNVVGYVDSAALLPSKEVSSGAPASPEEAVAAQQAKTERSRLPVIDRSQKIVGHLVEGAGFVPLGEPIPDLASLEAPLDESTRRRRD